MKFTDFVTPQIEVLLSVDSSLQCATVSLVVTPNLLKDCIAFIFTGKQSKNYLTLGQCHIPEYRTWIFQQHNYENHISPAQISVLVAIQLFIISQALCDMIGIQCCHALQMEGALATQFIRKESLSTQHFHF